MAKMELSVQEKKTLKSMFWNSGLVFCGFNMVKMEGNAFTCTMAPAIEELYSDPEERKQALVRHNNFFNTHAVLFSFIVRAGGSLAVLILQGGDLIQIRLSTLRRQGTEVSRAGGADCHRAGQYGAEHCLSDFVHRDSPSFYQTLASFLYCTAGVSLRQPENMGRFLSSVKYFTI